MSEFRRDPRIPYSGVVFISWKTFDGQRNHVLGRALDVSERGISIELAIRIPVGSFVRVRAFGLNLDCSGTVRRTSRRIGRHVLGLELSESVNSNLLAELTASQTDRVSTPTCAEPRTLSSTRDPR
jgi:PilZ domain